LARGDEARFGVGPEGRAWLVEVERAEQVAVEEAFGAAPPALLRPPLPPREPDRVGDLGRGARGRLRGWGRRRDRHAAIMPTRRGARGAGFRNSPRNSSPAG